MSLTRSFVSFVLFFFVFCLTAAALSDANAQVRSPVPPTERVITISGAQLSALLASHATGGLGQIVISDSENGESLAIMEPTSVLSAPSAAKVITDQGTEEQLPEIYHFRSAENSAVSTRLSVYRRDTDSAVVVSGALLDGGTTVAFESAPLSALEIDDLGSEIVMVARPVVTPRLDIEHAPSCEPYTLLTAPPQLTTVSTGLGVGGYGDRALLYRVAQLMIDADWEYVGELGSATNASAVIQATVNSMNGIYEPQLGIRLVVSSLTVWNTSNDPFDSSQPPFDEYFQFISSRARVNQGYDLAHLFTGRSLMAGTAVGRATASGGCLPSQASVARHSTTPSIRTFISAHELGHLLGAQHDSSGIMVPTVTSVDYFSAFSRSEIAAYRDSALVCLQPLTDDSDPSTAVIQTFSYLTSEAQQLWLSWAAPASSVPIIGYDVYRANSESLCAGSPYQRVGAERFDDPAPLPADQFVQYSVRPVTQSGYGQCAPFDAPVPQVTNGIVTEPNPSGYSSVSLDFALSSEIAPGSFLQLFRSTAAATGCAGQPILSQFVPVGSVIQGVSAPLAGYAQRQYFSARIIAPGSVGACSAPYSVSPTGAPVNVDASEGLYPDRVQITWTPPAQSLARLYWVYRFEVGNPATQVTVSSTAATTLTDTSAAADGRHYEYYVQACNASGCASSATVRGYRNALPPAPQNVAASDGTSPNSIVISWNPVNFGAVLRYRVYRSVTGPTGQYVLAGESASPIFSDSDATIQFGYPVAYKVSAVTALGEGALSNFDNGTVIVSVPAAVQISAVSEPDPVPNPAVVTVSWSNTTGTEAFFDVYRSTSSTPCSGTRVMRSSVQQASYSVPFEIPQYGVPHYFSVQGLNGAGVGPCSAAVAVALPQVLSVQVSAGSAASAVSLSWASSALARQFQIKRRPLGATEPFSLLATVDRGVLSYSDGTALADGTRYEYRVAACNVSGCTESATQVGWRAAPPSVPQQVAASDGTVFNAIDVTWSVPLRGNVDSYRIEQSVSVNGPFSSVATAPATALSTRISSGTPLRLGQQLFFRVVAVSSLGESAPSGVDAGAALVESPGTPTNLAVSEVANNLNIRWIAASGAPGLFEVYRSAQSADRCVGTPIASGISTTSYTDSSIVYGTQYFYSLRAVNAAGASSCAGSVTLALPPLFSTIASDGVSAASVSVLGSGTGSVSRSFRRSATGIAGSFVELARNTNFSFDDTTAPTDGTPMFYQVVGCNASGCGDGLVDAGRRRASPQAATNVVASDGAFVTVVRVSWSPNPRGYTQSFVVRRSGSAAGPFSAISPELSSSVTQFDDTTVTQGTVYYYQVEARGDTTPVALSAIDTGFAQQGGSSSSSMSSSSSSSSSSNSSASSTSSSSSSSMSSSSSVSSSSSSTSSSSSSVSSTSSSSSNNSSSSMSSSSSNSSSSSSSLTSSSSSSGGISSSSSSSSSPGSEAGVLGAGQPLIPSGSSLRAELSLRRVNSRAVRVQIGSSLINRLGTPLSIARDNTCSIIFQRLERGNTSRRTTLGTTRVSSASFSRIRRLSVAGGVRTSSAPRNPDTLQAVLRCGQETLSASPIVLRVPSSLRTVIRVNQIPTLISRALR